MTGGEKATEVDVGVLGECRVSEEGAVKIEELLELKLIGHSTKLLLQLTETAWRLGERVESDCWFGVVQKTVGGLQLLKVRRGCSRQTADNSSELQGKS